MYDVPPNWNQDSKRVPYILYEFCSLSIPIDDVGINIHVKISTRPTMQLQLRYPPELEDHSSIVRDQEPYHRYVRV